MNNKLTERIIRGMMIGGLIYLLITMFNNI